MNDDNLDSENLSLEVIEETLSDLKEKGLLDEIEIDGVPHYKLNALGKICIKHMDSDPKTQN